MSMQNHDLAEKPAKRRRKRGTYSYYLQDYPVLIPVVTLVLGGICVYSTIFSNLLRDLVMSGATRSAYDNFYTVTGWGVAFVLAIMFISFLFLVLHGIDVVMHRVRRKPVACEKCGAVEHPRDLPFTREAVDDTTDVDRVTCPRCLHQWFARG
jgi:hypothetical protein